MNSSKEVIKMQRRTSFASFVEPRSDSSRKSLGRKPTDEDKTPEEERTSSGRK